MGSLHHLGPLSQFATDSVTRVDVAGRAVALVRIGDDVYALGDRCSHGDVALSGGEVWCDERQLECSRHGSRFDLTTGVPQTLPATQPVPVYAVRVVNGEVELEVQ